MDKEGANPDRVKEELTKYGMVCEEWGGDVICVTGFRKTGEGIDDLLENILLVAETSELKANPDRRAKGTVVEARLDKGRGPIATLLVQNGTLHTGDVIIAGTAVGRVRVMTNDKGTVVESAGPSVPVEITGLAEVPEAGDIFNAVEDERLARELVEQRKHEAKQAKFNEYQKVTLDNLFSQIEQGEMKELSLIVKADVQLCGSRYPVAGEAVQRGSSGSCHPRRCRRNQGERCHAGKRIQRHHHRIQRSSRPDCRGDRSTG